MIGKYSNQQYGSLGGSNVPLRTGDRRWSQDRVRDFWFHQDRIGQIIADLFNSVPILLSGGVVSQGAGASLNITAGFGYAKFEVDIPDSFASLPPTVTQEDIEAIRVAWAAQTNINAGSANCSVYDITDDGATVHYVKMRYLETDGNTRTRAKYTGSYAYEITPEFDLQVDDVAPTDYDIELAQFTSSGGTYTITNTLKLKTLNDGGVPVGTIIAFIPGYFGDGSNGSYTGVSISLPSNWKDCDGSVPNDPDSPIFNAAGRYLPNLTDDRFLMGDIAASAGGIGGSNTQAVTQQPTFTIPNHQHQIGRYIWSVGVYRNYRSNGNEFNVFYSSNQGTLSAGSIHYVYAATAEDIDVYTATDGGGGSCTQGDNVTIDSENRPLYLSCRYIMRIK